MKCTYKFPTNKPMLNPSTIEELPSQTLTSSQVQRFRERLKLIETKVQKQSQEEKLNQVRALLREEATQILLPALQDAIVQMTVQVLPDPRLGDCIEKTSQEVSRVSEQVRTLAEVQRKAGESAKDATEKLASTMEAMFAATTEEVSAQHAKTAEELLREQRVLSRKQRFWSVAAAGLSAVLILLMATGALLLWQSDQKTKLGSELAELRQQKEQLVKQREQIAEETRSMEKNQSIASEALVRLRSEETAARLKIREAAETIASVDQARAKVQEDMKRLQEIQETNRFKLLPGTEGAVFVEVPTGTRPFAFQGKSYVRLVDKP
ncbi:MAG: hypothetical protein SFV32_02410 [Opitutaceae bacterium]|nr:hypothetical protein [Opitutaceae bacterium]